MKIVFTFWSRAKPFTQISFLKEMAAVSNFFAQKHGYETVLYTDDLGENFLYKIPYNNILRLPDNILNKFPNCIWNMGKVLTTSYINEPFIHLDLDLFLYKPIKEEFFKKEAVFFHEEIWMDKTLLDTSFIIKKFPKNLINKSYRSYNCAMFGGTNYKAFNQAAKEVCMFIIENADFLNKMHIQQEKLKNKGLVDNHLYLSYLVEQLWIPNLLKNNGINIDIILNDVNLKEYELKDYIKDYDPSNFLNKKNENQFVKEYYKYFSILNLKSKELGYHHCYSENKDIFKDKIIDFARRKNLTY